MRRHRLSLALLFLPGAALSHEILHEVERSRAVAVRVFYEDGEALADASYEVYSPRDDKVPYQRGRTDHEGYLSFVPDIPGSWRVRALDASGHGLEVMVEGGEAVGGKPASRSGAAGAGLLLLRRIAGVAIVASIFAGLALLYRRRGRPPG